MAFIEYTAPLRVIYIFARLIKSKVDAFTLNEPCILFILVVPFILELTSNCLYIEPKDIMLIRHFENLISLFSHFRHHV